MAVSWIFATLMFIFIPGSSISHEIVELVVPLIADPRESAVLSCRYDMGKDRLYSAKWFKDEQEIFRHMPGQRPAGLPFPVPGVKLLQLPHCSASACDLELTGLQPRSAGTYRCEVSTEAPTFRIKNKQANMTVAALPLRDPEVEGASQVYYTEEEIRLNCTSDPSMPPAEIKWYINDREASYSELGPSWSGPPDMHGLSTRSLGLRLRADKSLAGTGSLQLRCVAALPAGLPGGPHQRQFTIAAAVRSHVEQLNHRQEWALSGAHGLAPSSLFSHAVTLYMSHLILTRLC